MIYDKDSMYYQLNQAEPEDMERHVPMTIRERTAIRFWVRRGHSVESNPWDYRDSSGEPMNYLGYAEQVFSVLPTLVFSV